MSPRSRGTLNRHCNVPILRSPIEDRARALSYGVGVLWSIAFLAFTPSFYTELIDRWLLTGWGVVALVGCLMCLIGAITRIDFKLELPGIYLIQVSSLLYFTAQFGFFAPGSMFDPVDRIAAALYIVWHSSLFWPRWWRLAADRKRVHAVAKATL